MVNRACEAVVLIVSGKYSHGDTFQLYRRCTHHHHFWISGHAEVSIAHADPSERNHNELTKAVRAGNREELLEESA